MLAIVHVLAGAVIGIALDSAPAVLITAFFSHYFLDQLPHIDPATFSQRRPQYSWTELITLLSDTALTIAIGLILFFIHERWLTILIGSIAALLPDLLMPLEKYSIMTPFRRLHTLFHWNSRHAQQWSWYVAGLIMPLTIGLASSVILWFSL